MEITPNATSTFFMGLDDVRDRDSKIAMLASFTVSDGQPGAVRTA